MYKHGFETVTETDHRAWLWVASLLSLTYSVLCLGARLTGKWDLLSYDDGILGGAYVFAIAHYGVLLKTIYGGLGVSKLVMTSEQIKSTAEYYFASRLPYFIALCLSKISVLVFTRRIFSGDIYQEKIFFAVAYVLTAVYGLCGVLLSSAGCRPDQALALRADSVCDANVARWAVITSLDVVTEIVILALPVWFISKNQIKASKKRLVVFVFSFRLLVAGFSIGTTVTYFKYLSGSNLNIGVSSTIVWQEILLCVSLVSASIPCLRTFLWAFMSTGLMTIYNNGSTSPYPYGHGSQPSRHRSALRSQNHDDSQSQGRAFQSQLRPDRHEYNVDVRAKHGVNKNGDNRDSAEQGSVGSYGSEQYILHHRTEIEIRSSPATEVDG